MHQSQHHNIFALEASASAGCTQCSIFYSQLPDAEILKLRNQTPTPVAEMCGPTLYQQPNLWHQLDMSYIYLTYRKANDYDTVGKIAFVESVQAINEYKHRINSNTNCDASWYISHYWLKKCVENHRPCSKRTKLHRLPTRLLDLGRSGILTDIRLCESANLSQDIKYFTLSHCWGTLKFLMLLKGNIKAFQKSIPIQELSKTFQDSIVVTKRLGFRYLWIDSLCIIQDDDEDWQKESALMSMVYGLSTLNLTAAGAQDGSEGLFFQRSPSLVKRLEFSVPPDTKKSDDEVFQGVDLHLYDRCITWSPIAARGWTFQEQYLAPRSLHFGKSQLFWQCKHGYACETFPDGLPAELNPLEQSRFAYHREGILGKISNQQNHLRRNHSIRSLRQTGFLKEWHEVVHQYSKRKLTYGKDKLLAISGVARHLHEKFGHEYVAGLWKPELEWQLMWSVNSFAGLRSVLYRAPSWSWASVDGEIILGSDDDDIIWQTCLEILDTCIFPVATDPFGQLRDGHLQVRGRKMTYGKHMGRNGLTLIMGERSVEIECEVKMDAYFEALSTFYCLLVYDGTPMLSGRWLRGLILQACDSRPGYFSRRGMFKISPGNSEGFKSTIGAPVVDSIRTDFGKFDGVDEFQNDQFIITLV